MIASTNTTKDWFRANGMPARKPMKLVQTQWQWPEGEVSVLKHQACSNTTKLVQTWRSFKETNKTYQNMRVGWASRRPRCLSVTMQDSTLRIRDNASDDDSLRLPLREWEWGLGRSKRVGLQETDKREKRRLLSL